MVQAVRKNLVNKIVSTTCRCKKNGGCKCYSTSDAQATRINRKGWLISSRIIDTEKNVGYLTLDRVLKRVKREDRNEFFGKTNAF